jgi:hypothetical protein
MTHSTTSPNIIAFGNLNEYKKLFHLLNNEFLNNVAYKNKPNQISINATAPENVNSYEIKIRTKYYDSDLSLEIFPLNELDIKIDDKTIVENLEGVFLLVSQSSDHELIKNSKSCKNFFKSKENYLNILITNNYSDIISQEKVNHFLNQCENFVEIKLELNQDHLSSKEDSDNDESDFTSLDELINLFFVNNWSKRTLKSEKASNKIKEPEALNKEENKNAKEEIIPSTDKTKIDVENNRNPDDDDEDDDDDEFSFEHLIMNLNDMKSKASNLSFEERKKYAETVVKNFWQSMGGDENEIADLDQD